MKASLSVLLLATASLSLLFGCGGVVEGDEDQSDTLTEAQDIELGQHAEALSVPLACSIRAFDGHFLTAVGGGGRLTDVIHTDATRFAAWEQFQLVDVGDGHALHFGIRTVNGNFLTAVGGGGRITDVIHSDATRLAAWERFTLFSQGGGFYGIQTNDGHFLTAVDSGGRITDVIHSNATTIGTWEKFRIAC
jgi:hypothetical protein